EHLHREQRTAMLGQEREHTPCRDQLPAGFPHIRPDRLPGPFPHHHEKESGPTAHAAGPEPKIFTSLLGDADRLKAMAGCQSESPAARRDGSGERRGELDRQIRINRQALAIALGVAAKEVAARDLGLEESEKAVERQIAPLQTELGVLLDARRELRTRLAASDAAREQSAQLVELAATTRRMWNDLPLERQKELMATLEVEVTFLEPPQQGRKGQRCALAAAVHRQTTEGPSADRRKLGDDRADDHPPTARSQSALGDDRNPL
ncbi:hypothetical protein J7E91_30060, partial [Streptomyces sp. ISL-99]|uniref:hypothetical protein n=1 Tax=Streptomyces sp. ISL-99 TaxID=2819193 RepID=UPI001BE5AF9D